MHGTCANNNPSRILSRPPSGFDRLKKAVSSGSLDWSGFAPKCVSQTKHGSRNGCDSRTRHLLRSAKGQKPIPSLRAAHELHSVSADSNSDSNLHLKSQTTNCED
jgi:hypothetical protein